jgi:hypothetical protein
MKLVRAVDRLEVRGRLAAPCLDGVGLVWSRDEVRVTRDLEPGELIAIDMYQLEGYVPYEGAAPDTWGARLEERVTRDTQDLGFVYDVAGQVIGQVVELDGGMISWRARAPLARGLALLEPAPTAPLAG